MLSSRGPSLLIVCLIVVFWNLSSLQASTEDASSLGSPLLAQGETGVQESETGQEAGTTNAAETGLSDGTTNAAETGLSDGTTNAAETGEASAPAQTERMDDQSEQSDTPCDASHLSNEAMNHGVSILNGITLSESTPLSALLANPAQYEGQLVRIEGWCTHVCQHGGRRMALQDALGSQMFIKVNPGELDFRDITVPGPYVVAEGIFTEQGHRGPELYIGNNGAMVGTVVCVLPPVTLQPEPHDHAEHE